MNTENVVFEEVSGSTQAVTTSFESVDGGTKADYVTRTDKDMIVVKDQRLADFLAKPILLADYNWATADLFNSDIVTFDLDAQVLTNTIWANKISGYGLVRGNVKILVTVNATPFHQGRLWAHYLPHLNAIAPYSTAYLKMHHTLFSSKRMLPGVELDVVDSMAELDIPFVSPVGWLQVNSGVASSLQYGWGQFYLTVQSVLRTGAAGTDNCDVSVWMSLENAEFAAPMVPQMDGGGGRRFKTKVFKSVSEKEAEASGVGAVSKGLSAVSVAADALSAIPFMSSVMQPASWVANILSGVAGAFGWAKPLDLAAPGIMSAQYNRYTATSDGVSTAVPLALVTSHAVTMTDGMSIRDEDEMSWNFLRSISTLTNTLTWNVTDTINTTLGASYPLCPALTNSPLAPMWEAGTIMHTKLATYAVGAPFLYLAQKFGFYRGSICLVLKFIKTQYHTGRLSITWTPTPTVGTAVTNTNAQYALREIVDISTTNEVCLMLPWMNEWNYLPITSNFGTLDIKVLNVLRAPETAYQHVDIQMFFSGGPDFEVAVPCSGLTPLWTPQPFSPEMGMESKTDDTLVDCNVGNCDLGVAGLLPAQQSIGERFTSIKQLLNRTSRWWSSSAVSATFCLAIWPWSSTVVYSAASGPLFNVWGGDIYGYLAPMFLFYRGDMEVSITLESATNYMIGYNHSAPLLTNALSVSATALTGVTDPMLGALAWGQTAGSTQYAAVNTGIGLQKQTDGLTSWRVPYYARGKASFVIPASNNSEIPASITKSYGLLVVNSPASLASCRLYRSVADDFQFSYFLGNPPLLLTDV